MPTPRLFTTLRFRGHPQTTRSEVFWSNLPKMDEQRCYTLLACARDCTFYWWFDSAAMDRALFKTLRCANLTGIALLRCSLSISTLVSVAETPNLRTVVFDTCELQSSGVSTPIYAFIPRWTSLSVLSIQNRQLCPWFISNLLRLVDLEYLEYFSTDHVNLASSLFRGRHASHLHTFRMGWGGGVSDLFAILEAMPNITKLLVYSDFWPTLYPPPRHIASRLNSLTAYHSFATQFVPLRPVTSLEILDGVRWNSRWPDTCFQDMRGSTTGSREVSFPTIGLTSIRTDDLPVVKTSTLRPRCGKKVQTVHFSVCIYFLNAPRYKLNLVPTPRTTSQ